MQVNRIGDSFAAEVAGIDIASGISPAVSRELIDVLAEYPVICIRDQKLNDEQQTAFAGQFGPLLLNEFEELGGKPGGDEKLLYVATVDKHGKPIEKHSLMGKMAQANLLWHADGTHQQKPVRYTTLSARILPSDPPPTEYVDLRRAWDLLPESRKYALEELQVVHSVLESRRKMGMLQDEFTQEFVENFSNGVVKPLVRTNAISGRKSLYLASHASHIVDMPLDEGRALLEELTAFAVRRENVYVHRWQPFDLMIWDNFCLMHRATEYDGSEPRYLRWSGSLAEAEHGV